MADDLQALRERDDRQLPLRELAHLIGDHPGDQVVAVLLGEPQDVEVPHMEEVVCTRCVPDDASHVSLLQ